MEENLDNANPTILNASDLPSRRRESTVKQRHDGSTGLFDAFLPAYVYPYSSIAAPSSSVASSTDSDEEAEEEIDAQEIYDLIKNISDPEHPLSLGSLAVINLPDIHITPPSSPRSRISTVVVDLTPTISHCSLATVIGLGVRVRLEQALPPRFRVDVRIKEGTHSTAKEVTKQLGDKERVAAAVENATLMGVIATMLKTCE